MEFGLVFAAPVKEEIAGTEVLFPVLTCAELAPLSASIRADRIAAAERGAKARGFSDIQAYQAVAQAERLEVSINDILDRIASLGGSELVCRHSLMKVGKPAEYIDGVLRLMSLAQLGNVAMRVSRVKAPAPLKPQTDAEREINRPLPSSGEAPVVTGSPRTPMSDTPTASIPAR